ncbi:ATP-binding protein [Desulfosediminicola flagellatus]|uniref:sensor histidine kinase n=1 Tax=Desulfosediminicola flagellatus TaxID=2569541 RepID=UPI0010AD1F61|nr:ATP-binding protein [Desulfosediminicola flagellatus]
MTKSPGYQIQLWVEQQEEINAMQDILTFQQGLSTMPVSLSLRSKLICIFAAMTSIVLVCCLVMLWNTHMVSSVLEQAVQKELVLYKTAQEMELALANQKGFLTYYFVDGNADWLKSLNSYRDMFKQSMDRAFALDLDPRQRQTLEKITTDYEKYKEAKDFAIENYTSYVLPGSISALHEKQRDVFFNLLELCRTFSQEQWQLIQASEKAAVTRSHHLKVIAGWAILIFIALCSLFLYFLYHHILQPIRDLAIETGSNPEDSYMDEVLSLSHSLKGMMRDFDATHDELAKSRRNLLQAERMAVVGELAAGIAHTIRNPFTSIKMRMFSLSRSLNLSDVQNEDLQVISTEIDRIDKIVGNFLEFARPPKLKFEECCLKELVNSVATLLVYRLKQYGAELCFTPDANLSPVKVDPDRIKEALLNLITNSCEAMEQGGTITISESREHHPEKGEVGVLSVKDTGPGIPDSILHKVTAPFFTTKEDGSGLGLSIVSRIAREHEGEIVIPPSDNGAEIQIKIPV